MINVVLLFLVHKRLVSKCKSKLSDSSFDCFVLIRPKLEDKQQHTLYYTVCDKQLDVK